MGWVLANVYAERLFGLEDKLVCCLKLAADKIRASIWELMDYTDGLTFLKRKLVQFGIDKHCRSKFWKAQLD